MKQYVMTSNVFEGEVILTCSDAGFVQGFNFENCRLSEQQHAWLLRNMPRNEFELKELARNTPSLRLQEVLQEVTFDMFWKKYNDMQCSSKARTRKKWDRMPKAQQSKAYRYIDVYFRNLPQGTRKKYAETYLNAELWNN